MTTKRNDDLLDFAEYAKYLNGDSNPSNKSESITNYSVEADLKEVASIERELSQQPHVEITQLPSSNIDSSLILKQVVETSPDLIFSINLNFELLSANTACKNLFRDVFGIELKVGHSLFQLLSNFDRESHHLLKCFSRTLHDESFSVEMPLTEGVQAADIFDAQFSVMKNANGKIAGVSCIFRNVSERVLKRDKFEFLADHDAVTRLKNRSAFLKTTDFHISTLRKNQDQSAMLFVGVEGLKALQDECGYNAYDRALLKLSMRLRKVLGKQSELARVSDHCFAVLLEDISLELSRSHAEALVRSIDEFKFVWRGRSYSLQANVGITKITGKSIDSLQAIEQADLACSMVKTLRNQSVFVNIHS